MAIGVERERNRAVAEELLHYLGVHTTAEEVRGRCVPEVVDPDAGETSLIERSMKAFDRPGCVDRSSCRRREEWSFVNTSITASPFTTRPANDSES